MEALECLGFIRLDWHSLLKPRASSCAVSCTVAIHIWRYLERRDPSRLAIEPLGELRAHDNEVPADASQRARRQ